MKMQLHINDKISVYEMDESLIISFGDSELVKVHGKEKNLLEIVLKNFRTETDPEIVYERVRSDFGSDRTQYELILHYLIDNDLLLITQPPENLSKNIVILGNFEDCKQAAQLISKSLNSTYVKYKLLWSGLP